MEPLTRKYLDRAHCMSPGCTHESHGGLFMHGKCHMDADVEAEYLNGILHIRCAECGNPVADVKVAAS